MTVHIDRDKVMNQKAFLPGAVPPSPAAVPSASSAPRLSVLPPPSRSAAPSPRVSGPSARPRLPFPLFRVRTMLFGSVITRAILGASRLAPHRGRPAPPSAGCPPLVLRPPPSSAFLPRGLFPPGPLLSSPAWPPFRVPSFPRLRRLALAPLSALCLGVRGPRRLPCPVSARVACCVRAAACPCSQPFRSPRPPFARLLRRPSVGSSAVLG